ncbi:hypothetical protein LTR94_027010, partial [Friedmanniomyces endolithicus]
MIAFAEALARMQVKRDIAALRAAQGGGRQEDARANGAFEDAAISGAAGIGADQRPGLNAMMRMVEAGGVDQVLAESTDRISRHVADAHILRERIEFAGARLFTLFDGAVTPMIGLIKGFTDAQFRTDLAKRVRRGQL